MRRLWLLVPLAALSLLSDAMAGGPPIVNSTDRLIEVPVADVGIDCATGKDAAITGVVTGVVHTLVLADGSVHVSGTFRGNNAFDDLPVDGVLDATSRFVTHFDDLVFASGREVHTMTLSGIGTALATDAKVGFQLVFHVVLDSDGTPTVEFLHVECR